MKLKELHIRNIASIERADIDFEHGLNDAVTGDPASIFLISGDTGAGKSVILDCISMALYKKTPRIVDVANKRENTFTDNDGETVKIGSIEQYTRLGISDKDDSYSEVVFEGNDSKNYHARLTLGIKLNNKNKTVKHRTPVWELRTDDGDWTKDSVEQTILHAVGLDFQQFGRMAMLAQGQFANFLTGDKKEREAILEQLTDTQHFTAYGEAIQSLWKKAKDAQAQAQTQYDTEKPHTLTDEQAEQTGKELEEAQKLMSQCDKEIRETEHRLKLVDTILDNEKKHAEAQQAKQQLETQMAADDYRQSKALFSVWDDTTDQRQQLSLLLRARRDQAKAQDDLLPLSDTFQQLTADIAYRQQKAQARKADISQTEEWLDKQRHHEELFKKADATDIKIAQYLDHMKSADQLEQRLKEERGKTSERKKTEDEARKQALQADHDVKKMQDKIDLLNKKRSELNPQAIIDQQKLLHERRQSLDTLHASTVSLKALTDDTLKLQSKLKAAETARKDLEKAYVDANADCDAKKLLAEKAMQRLTTMKMSLDEKISILRHRLYTEHAERCPLCGQHIDTDHLHLEDDFRNMLTPLEQEQQQADANLTQAVKLRDDAMGNLRQHDGTLRSNRQQIEDNRRKIELQQEAIRKQSDLLGFDSQKPLDTQIAHAIEMLKAATAVLESKQRDAERLQKEINTLTEEKKPLDQQKLLADRARIKAENALKTNADNIMRMEDESRKLALKCSTLKTEISTALAGYCAHWLTDVQALRKQLASDAKTFTDRQKLLADNKAEAAKEDMLLTTLCHCSQGIMQSCPQWKAATAPSPHDSPDINAEWTALQNSVTALTSTINNCKSVIATAVQNLETYYRQTGMTEESLLALTAQEQQVITARQNVAAIDAQMKSRCDALAEAQRQIAAALQALGTAHRSALPPKEELEEKKTLLLKKRDDALALCTQLQTQLQMNRKNAARLKQIAAELETAKQRYNRWDRLNSHFGGTRFRTLVQTHILRPLLTNANIYLEQITDRYRLTCSSANEQLAILVLDRYNKNQVRSVTVLSGGERFMISLALSLALSSLNRPDMNVNILFIDEGFGTLDERSLHCVMQALERLQDIAGQSNRRVGIISHREELAERIPVNIRVVRKGEGRSDIEIEGDRGR